MAESPVISRLSLPTDPTVTFDGSSFFTRNGRHASLPSLAEVLALNEVQNTPDVKKLQNPRPVCFESLGLVVKFGRDQTVAISEGQCLWALRRYLPELPVPEIYGWSTEEDYVLLFMEHIKGVTVENKWDTMTDQERINFSEEMKSVIAKLRSLRQDSTDRFLGKMFIFFSTVMEFNT